MRAQRGADRARTRRILLSADRPQLHLYDVWRGHYDLALGFGCDISGTDRDAGPDLDLRHRHLVDAYRPVWLQSVNTSAAGRSDHARRPRTICAATGTNMIGDTKVTKSPSGEFRP